MKKLIIAFLLYLPTIPAQGVVSILNSCSKYITQSACENSVTHYCTWDTTSNKCDTVLYTINLYPYHQNSGWGRPMASTIYYKYNLGFSNSETALVWHQSIQITPPTRDHYSFRGYSTDFTLSNIVIPCSGDTQITIDQNTPLIQNIINNRPSNKTISVYGVYQGDEYRIRYAKPGGNTNAANSCQTNYYEQTCNYGQPCTVLSYKQIYDQTSNWPEQNCGDLEWSVYTIGQTNLNPPTKKPGEPLNSPTTTNTSATANYEYCLTPNVKPYPQGYYCQNNQKAKCPAGTTSSQGADAITDCYITRGTIFSGSNGIITVPDRVEKINLKVN